MPFRPLQDAPVSLSNLQEDINNLIGRIWHAGVSTRPFDGQQWAPVVDIHEYEDRYALYAEIPGVDGDTVELSYLDGALTIRGEKTKPAGLDDAEKSLRCERRFGTFCRTVDLPPGVDTERLSAQCQAGVLQVTIPKSETSRSKAIKIKVEEG